MIQFQCSNISEFDPETGRYVNCDQRLSAKPEHAGLRVRCPKCQQAVDVPAAARSTKPQLQQVAAGNARQEELPGEFASNAESATGQLDYGRFDQKMRCRKCGSLLDKDKHCTQCRYVRPVVKPDMTPLEHMQVQPAGFQLWFSEILADGAELRLFELVAHGLFIVLMAMCCVVAWVLGGPNLIIGLVVVGLISVGYLVLVATAKRLAHKAAAGVPFWLKPIWNGLLLAARSLEWQKYDSRLKGRVIIDQRGTNFGDRELLTLPDLNTCSVLDLQGTDVTDNGLLLMHGLKHLRCLVLRGTHVSREGVFRLQQAIPHAWIWY